MFIAKKDFTCAICKQTIHKGSTDFRFRRFGKGEWDTIHASCKQAVKQEAVKEEVYDKMFEQSENVTVKEKSNVENAIKDLVSKLVIPQTIDENMVRKIVKEETAKATRTVEFKVADVPTFKVKLAHKSLESLVKLVSIRTPNGHRQNVYLHGPAGSGKSSGARQVKDILGMERYGYISLNPQTPDSRILGFVHAGGQYVESEFFRCYVYGGVFCIDEIDNASASLLTTLEELQSWVGGMIEPVRLEYGRPTIDGLVNMRGYANEEGLMIGLKSNASFPGFVGPVVVLPKGCRV